MALGARPRDVVRFILRQSLMLTVSGTAIGIGPLSAIGCGRLHAALLFGVGATDLMTHGEITMALLPNATLAAYLPARRAARIRLGNRNRSASGEQSKIGNHRATYRY